MISETDINVDNNKFDKVKTHRHITKQSQSIDQLLSLSLLSHIALLC